MRAYTLSVLTKLAGDDSHAIVEKEIVAWANTKVGYINILNFFFVVWFSLKHKPFLWHSLFFAASFCFRFFKRYKELGRRAIDHRRM